MGRVEGEGLPIIGVTGKPFLLVASSRGHVDVDLESSRRVFARPSRRTVAIHNLLAARAVAEHRVRVALRACHFILAKLDHLHFRVKRAGVLDGLRELLFRSQDEHFGLAFLVLMSDWQVKLYA